VLAVSSRGGQTRRPACISPARASWHLQPARTRCIGDEPGRDAENGRAACSTAANTRRCRPWPGRRRRPRPRRPGDLQQVRGDVGERLEHGQAVVPGRTGPSVSGQSRTAAVASDSMAPGSGCRDVDDEHHGGCAPLRAGRHAPARPAAIARRAGPLAMTAVVARVIAWRESCPGRDDERVVARARPQRCRSPCGLGDEGTSTTNLRPQAGLGHLPTHPRGPPPTHRRSRSGTRPSDRSVAVGPLPLRAIRPADDVWPRLGRAAPGPRRPLGRPALQVPLLPPVLR
jgi:hypothetical protein